MSDTEHKKGEQIKGCFDPEVYLKRFFTVPEADTISTVRVFHKFVQTGIKGKRLLDISTGPTPHTVISAASVVENIYLSDFIPVNRDYLYKWLTGTTSKDYFGPVVKLHTESNKTGESWEEVVDDIKSKVTGIFPVDLSKDNPMEPNLFPQFDIITSSYAFEAASYNTSSDYADVAKRVSQLLKPGGHLMVCGSLDESYYRLADDTYHVLPCSREMVKKSFEDAGFVIKGWEEIDRPEEDPEEYSDYTKTFFMHSVKKH